jgi:hypothetical protein
MTFRSHQSRFWFPFWWFWWDCLCTISFNIDNKDARHSYRTDAVPLTLLISSVHCDWALRPRSQHTHDCKIRPPMTRCFSKFSAGCRPPLMLCSVLGLSIWFSRIIIGRHTPLIYLYFATNASRSILMLLLQLRSSSPRFCTILPGQKQTTHWRTMIHAPSKFLPFWLRRISLFDAFDATTTSHEIPRTHHCNAMIRITSLIPITYQ